MQQWISEAKNDKGRNGKERHAKFYVTKKRNPGGNGRKTVCD